MTQKRGLDVHLGKCAPSSEVTKLTAKQHLLEAFLQPTPLDSDSNTISPGANNTDNESKQDILAPTELDPEAASALLMNG